MSRLRHIALAAVALLAVPVAAGAQDNLRRMLMLESREFLDQHWKKLENWDPAAVEDLAPEAARRILSRTRGGGEAATTSQGPELRTQMTRELAGAKARGDRFDYADVGVTLQGSNAIYCAKPVARTSAPPPAPPPPAPTAAPSGPAQRVQPAPPPPPPAAPPVPERVCWTIGAPTRAGYQILEIVVSRRG